MLILSTLILLFLLIIYDMFKIRYNISVGVDEMGMSETIRITLVKRGNMSEAELARRIGIKPQTLNKKMNRDNFSEEDLKEIAKALNCTYKAQFILNDTGEIL